MMHVTSRILILKAGVGHSEIDVKILIMYDIFFIFLFAQIRYIEQVFL